MMLMITPSPDFERVRKALLRQEPDRVPLMELLVDREVKDAFLGRPCADVEAEVEFWYKAGYDYVSLVPSYSFNPAGRRPKEGERVGVAKYDAYHAEPQSKSWATESRGIITSWQDFEEHVWQRPEEVDYSILEDAAKILPDGMQIIARTGDIFTHTWQLMGYETFCYALAEQPDLVEAIFRKVGEHIYAVFKTMVDMPAIGAFWYCDDIAYTEGLLASPRVFRKNLFPWIKKIGALAKKKGVPYIYHTDGVLWEVFDDLIDCGIDAIHPIEPKAMDIVEVKRKLGRKLAVIGNIDLGFTLVLGTPEKVEAEVREKIKALAPGGGYLLGSSNTIANYVPLRNYLAMIEATFKYGKYPV